MASDVLVKRLFENTGQNKLPASFSGDKKEKKDNPKPAKRDKPKDTNPKRSPLFWIVNILFWFCITVAFLVTGSLVLTKYINGIPSFLGYTLVRISSGSMRDAGFDVGSSTIIKGTDVKTLKAQVRDPLTSEVLSVGDYIAFYDHITADCWDPTLVTATNKPDAQANRENVIIFHEIIDIQTDMDGKRWFITKGTNNVSNDSHKIYENYVLGKYVNVGNSMNGVINFVFSKNGILIFITVPAILLLGLNVYQFVVAVQDQSTARKRGK